MPTKLERAFLWIVGGAYVALGVSFAPRGEPFFRPWERMLEGDDSGRFVRDAAVTMPTCGDLSYNIRHRQVWRLTTFTTDPVGLRNPPWTSPPRVVVVGDSYVAGANLDDAETISARLARELGEPVYNAGSPFPVRELGRLPADPRFRGAPPRAVVIMLASHNLVAPEAPDHPTWTLPEDPLLRSAEEVVGRTLERVTRDSRLAGWAGRQVGRVRGLVGVHPYREVRWGDVPALCLSPREQRYLDHRAAEHAERLAAGLRSWRDRLAASGTTLIFAPVPSSAVVYPELFSPRDLGEGEPLVAACVAATRRAGIMTVDLLPAFRANRTPYLFEVGDSHWSPRAVEVAAAAIAAELGPLLTR